MKIITGRKYTDTGQPQVFDVINIVFDCLTGDRMNYTEPRTGYRGHVVVKNDLIYAPNLLAGDYYPTQYKIEG